MEKTAIEAFQHDNRFRAICLGAVSEALRDAEDILRRPDKIEVRDVQEVALNAAINALKRAFDNDAELTVVRMERDHYKKLALHGLDLKAMPSLVLPA